MKHKKIKGERAKATIMNILYRLQSLSKKHCLHNVDERCSLFIKKMSSCETLDAKKFNVLKNDLYADILGPLYYDIEATNQYKYGSLNEFKIFHSLDCYDKHVFGWNEGKKIERYKPVDLRITEQIQSIHDDSKLNLFDNMDAYYLNKQKGSNGRENIEMLLSSFRSLQYSIVEAHKEYLHQIEQRLYGHEDKQFWNDLLKCDNTFMQNDGEIVPDFVVIGGAHAHGKYKIDVDNQTVTLLLTDFVEKEKIYAIADLERIINTTAFKFMVGIPALIMIEELANSNMIFEEIDDATTN